MLCGSQLCGGEASSRAAWWKKEINMRKFSGAFQGSFYVFSQSDLTYPVAVFNPHCLPLHTTTEHNMYHCSLSAASWFSGIIDILTSGLVFIHKRLRGALHLHAGHVGCEAPLEQEIRVWWLVITVQLPAHEVLPKAMWTRSTGCSHMSGSPTGITFWKHREKSLKVSD